MNRKIVIAGGTGFIGKYLVRRFRQGGFRPLTIARENGDIRWSDQTGIVRALEGASMLINLAGKSVDCRYNEKNKAAIQHSRVDTTTALGRILASCDRPPSLWINASTATIYRHAEDRPMTESKGEIGQGFSVKVAKAWEKSFFAAGAPGVRQAALRIAIVLGAGGGALAPFVRLVRFGLGGPQGSGKQKFSWIHLDDLFGIIRHVQTHEELDGVFNASAPNPVDNAALMRTLRHIRRMPFGLPTPKWLLEVGARLIHTETELILKSRWVLPERIERTGYQFRFAHLEDALRNILEDPGQ